MKRKDILQMIDAVEEEQKRDECTFYRNAVEWIFTLKDNEQLSVFRAVFLYSLYGIEPNFDEMKPKKQQNLMKNRQIASSFNMFFSLLKKQRIGWESATKSENNNQTPQRGSPQGTLHGVPPQGFLYKDKDIKDKDIKDNGGYETKEEETARLLDLLAERRKNGQ